MKRLFFSTLAVLIAMGAIAPTVLASPDAPDFDGGQTLQLYLNEHRGPNHGD